MRPGRIVVAARAVLSALLAFLLLVAALHLLRPDYDFRARWLSEYAVGPYGWLMNTAFLTLAFAEAMLTLGMLSGTAPSRWLRLGAVCLGLAALAMALLPLFPTDLDIQGQARSRVRTSAGRLHDQVGPLHGYALLAAMGCWTVAFRRALAWRKLVWPTLMLAGLMVANHILAPVLVPRAWAGLSQRFAVLLAVAWLAVVGQHLLRRSVKDAPARSVSA